MSASLHVTINGTLTKIPLLLSGDLVACYTTPIVRSLISDLTSGKRIHLVQCTPTFWRVLRKDVEVGHVRIVRGR